MAFICVSVWCVGKGQKANNEESGSFQLPGGTVDGGSSGMDGSSSACVLSIFNN